MAKHVVFESGYSNTDPPINWDKCAICQNDTTETLQCPADSKRSDRYVGYESFTNILPDFVNAKLLTPRINVEHLDEGDGILATLILHRAKWHQSCRLHYYSTQLDRGRKRKSADFSEVSSDCSAIGSDVQVPTRTVYRRSMSVDVRKSSVYVAPVCFLCDGLETDTNDPTLHTVTTLHVDDNVKKCAAILGDSALLAKLSDSDLVAQEAKYHLKCLCSLYKSRDKFVAQQSRADTCELGSLHGLVFAQLVSYINEARNNVDVAPIFKLANLVKMYRDRIAQLGGVDQYVHSSRLKERLQDHFPNMRAQPEGRDILLVFDSDIGPALAKACQSDIDHDALSLAKAAEIVRRTIFSTVKPFTGNMTDNCQLDSVPPNLLALVGMILEGPSIKAQSTVVVPAALSISQLLTYNSIKHNRCVDTVNTDFRRSQTQETPLPLYISLLLHATTRKRSLIDRLFHLGLCVSYDRIMQVTADLANRVCDQYHANETVCPPQLLTKLFTVGAVDNIDHNMTSSTAQTSFHGTGISLMQQPHEHTAVQHLSLNVIESGVSTSKKTRTVRSLPNCYTEVPPVRLKHEQPIISTVDGPHKGMGDVLTLELSAEYKWLDTVKMAIDPSVVVPRSDVQWFSWAAFHAAHNRSVHPISIISMLPLFQDSSTSVAMIKHSMDVVQRAVHFLNPGQPPVITFDQPLYAIAKSIQWNWSEYGEDRFVTVMGGLHIEMAVLKALGFLLKDSGWVEALSTANVATPGTAESLLYVSHIKRCRHFHEVTCSVLHLLKQRAYDCYCSSLEHQLQPPLSFSCWCDSQVASNPQFAFWSLIMDLELFMFTFVRSLRESNFALYIDSMTKLMPFFFALDRTRSLAFCTRA